MVTLEVLGAFLRGYPPPPRQFKGAHCHHPRQLKAAPASPGCLPDLCPAILVPR